jgi:adenylate kinase
MKPFNQKQIIILIGPPGAGKGTQAELLADKISLYYLETSKIIEANIMEAKEGDYEEVGGKKYFMVEERNRWKSGKLNTPEVVTFWLNEKIRELSKEGKGIIMAGSPRTLYEAENEAPVLKKEYGLKNIKVVLINLSAEQSIFRNSHRRLCQLMRHPILYIKETKNLTICPLDGSKFVRREGLDDPETITVRLKEYENRTLPLVDYLKKESFDVKEVNGEQSVADVFKDILKAIK